MRLISAQEIVKEFGISYQAINSYTDLGLLDVVAKRSRLRLYDYAKTKRRLNDILRLINEGYTLRLIRKILNEGKSR